MPRDAQYAVRLSWTCLTCALRDITQYQRAVLRLVAFGAFLALLAPGAEVLASPSPQMSQMGQRQTVTLSGSVRDEEGHAITSGAVVRLESNSGELVAQQPVTTAGQYGFTEIPKILCRLVVTAEGYETFSESIDLGRGSNDFFENVTLRRATKIKRDTSDLPTRSDNEAPKDAHKEFEKGERALQARKLGPARTHLAKAVEIYPCYARAQASLALVLISRHDSKPAEAALRKAIDCDPDFVDSYIVLGQLLNGEKRYEESRPVLEEGVRRSPASWQFHYQLGVAYYGMGKDDLAEQEYRKVLSLDPMAPADVHVKLADVYIHQRLFDKAYSEMQAYLTAEPKGRFADRIKSVMSQMVAAGAVRPPQAMTSEPPSRQR